LILIWIEAQILARPPGGSACRKDVLLPTVWSATQFIDSGDGVFPTPGLAAEGHSSAHSVLE